MNLSDVDGHRPACSSSEDCEGAYAATNPHSLVHLSEQAVTYALHTAAALLLLGLPGGRAQLLKEYASQVQSIRDAIEQHVYDLAHPQVPTKHSGCSGWICGLAIAGLLDGKDEDPVAPPVNGAIGPLDASAILDQIRLDDRAPSSYGAVDPATLDFADNESLVKGHFEKHVVQRGEFEGFGYNTASDYLAGARSFFAGDRGEDALQSYVRRNGDTVLYDFDTNEFGVVNKSGTIRTYFQPEDKAAYFEEDLIRNVPLPLVTQPMID